MKRIAKATSALLLLIWVFAGLAAEASETVKQSEKASAKGRVSIENIAGTITVIGWNKKEIRVEGTLGDDVKELKFKTGKRKSVIEVIYPKHIKTINEGADLVIMVPEQSQVQVDCISADVMASKLKRDLELSSISGDIEFTGWCEELVIEAISGSVTIDGGADKISVEAISGEVQAKGKETQIEVDCVSGNVELDYELFLDFSLENVSGNIKVRGDLHPEGRFGCDVVSGDITLEVPGNVSAEFEASTFDGKIANEFGPKARRTSQYTPGRELEFTNGDGEASVELNSFSGDIKILKK